jgi:hypothetical protein
MRLEGRSNDEWSPAHQQFFTARLTPRVGGTFRIQIFIQPSSPKICSEIISGRRVAGAVSGVACFGLPPLEKITGGVTAIISFRLACAILSLGSTGGIGQ